MARLEIDFLTEYDDAALIAELQRIAKAAGSDTVTKADIKRIGRISHSAIVRRFGSLRRALLLAGLRSARFMKATDEELLAIIIDLRLKRCQEPFSVVVTTGRSVRSPQPSAAVPLPPVPAVAASTDARNGRRGRAARGVCRARRGNRQVYNF